MNSRKDILSHSRFTGEIGGEFVRIAYFFKSRGDSQGNEFPRKFPRTVLSRPEDSYDAESTLFIHNPVASREGSIPTVHGNSLVSGAMPPPE
jgi:hypothetical protein